MSDYHSIRDETVSQLRDAYPQLKTSFGIVTIGLFGSVSRGDDCARSDINILYLFDTDRGDLNDFVGLHEYLELLFHRTVNMVSLEYLDEYMRPSIKRDALLFGEATELL